MRHVLYALLDALFRSGLSILTTDDLGQRGAGCQRVPDAVVTRIATGENGLDEDLRERECEDIMGGDELREEQYAHHNTSLLLGTANSIQGGNCQSTETECRRITGNPERIGLIIQVRWVTVERSKWCVSSLNRILDCKDANILGRPYAAHNSEPLPLGL